MASNGGPSKTPNPNREIATFCHPCRMSFLHTNFQLVPMSFVFHFIKCFVLRRNPKCCNRIQDSSFLHCNICYEQNSFHCLPAMATVGSGGGPNPVGCLKQVHNEWLNTKNFLEILESEMLQCNPGFYPRIANTLWTNSLQLVFLPASHGHCWVWCKFKSCSVLTESAQWMTQN